MAQTVVTPAPCFNFAGDYLAQFFLIPLSTAKTLPRQCGWVQKQPDTEGHYQGGVYGGQCYIYGALSLLVRAIQEAGYEDQMYIGTDKQRVNFMMRQQAYTTLISRSPRTPVAASLEIN